MTPTKYGVKPPDDCTAKSSHASIAGQNITTCHLGDSSHENERIQSRLSAYSIPATGVYYVEVQTSFVTGTGIYNANVYLSTITPLPGVGEFRVNTVTVGNQGRGHPAVAMDGNGDFVVAWDGNGSSDGFYDVHAQRYGLTSDNKNKLPAEVEPNDTPDSANAAAANFAASTANLYQMGIKGDHFHRNRR